jgi:hypothetical protein
MDLTTRHVAAGYLEDLPTEILVAIFESIDDNAVRLRALAALVLTCQRFRAIATPMLYATAFTRLPTEALTKIFGYLAYDDDPKQKGQGDLAAVALVCRQFQHLVTPILYSTLRSCCYLSDQHFELAIASHPPLAGYVKRFVVNQDHRCMVHRYTFHNGRQEWLREDVLARAAEFHLDKAHLDKISILRQYSMYKGHWLRALFIVLKCHNIEEFDVEDPDFLAYWPLTWAASKDPVGLLYPFEKLHTLSLRVEVLHTYPFKRLKAAFQLPSLRTLKLRDATLNIDEDKEVQARRSLMELTRGSSLIEELILEHCYVDYRCVVEAIETCAALRRFSWVYRHSGYKHMGGRLLYPAVLGALSKHASSLEDVQINELDICGTKFEDPPASLTWWKDCTRLEYLDLPLFTLGHSPTTSSTGSGHTIPRLERVSVEQVLPHSLKVLTIDLRTRMNGPSDNFFIDIAEAASRGYFYALERVEVITVHGRRHLGFALPLHFCHLQRMFAAQNIEFLYFIEFASCEAHGRKFPIYFDSILVEAMSVLTTVRQMSTNAWSKTTNAMVQMARQLRKRATTGMGASMAANQISSAARLVLERS